MLVYAEWPKRNVNIFFGVVYINDGLNAVSFSTSNLFIYFWSETYFYHINQTNLTHAKKNSQMTLCFINNKINIWILVLNLMISNPNDVKNVHIDPTIPNQFTEVFYDDWHSVSFWRENIKTWYIKTHLKSTQFIIGSKMKVNMNNM